MKQTIRDKLIAGMKAKGWTEAVSVSTRKYVAFKHAEQRCYLFVGKKGALRSGPMVSKTHSLEDSNIYRDFISEGSSQSATRATPFE